MMEFHLPTYSQISCLVGYCCVLVYMLYHTLLYTKLLFGEYLS